MDLKDLQDHKDQCGPQGPRGNYWRPTVDAGGNISWSDSSSETPPSSTNIKGPRGEDGKERSTRTTRTTR